MLTPRALAEKPALGALRRALEAWDGRAEVESLGFGLLTRFRTAFQGCVYAISHSLSAIP